jgi:hypothetical protein
MELRCPACVSPEVELRPEAESDEAMRCANCGARVERGDALVCVREVSGLADGPHPDSIHLDRIATYMSQDGPWSGADVCEFVDRELRASGRPIPDCD